MIGDLTPYLAYKDSGVPWLDTCPLIKSVRRKDASCSQ